MKKDSQIFPAVFEENKWKSLHKPGPRVKTKGLKFVTYNIWFGDHFFSKRLAAILDLLKKTNADIIALQEVNEHSLQKILKTDWIREKYYISDITGSTFYSYGVLILSRVPIKSLSLYPLTSMLGRNILIAEFILNGQKLLVGTSHLESLKHSDNIRIVQLKEIFSLLNQSENAVLMGDLNFCSSWAENNRIDQSYKDVWSLLRPNEPGYTEDAGINIMRKQLKREEEKVRFDRVLLKGSLPGWQPKQIKRLGMEPISSKYPDVFPSDHFGLMTQFDWSEK